VTQALGSLAISSDGPGVIGDVIFGDPNEGLFAAGLPLQPEPFQTAVFSQIANIPGVFFTGLAVFNPNEDTASLRLEAYSPEGRLVDQLLVTLEPKNRFSKSLVELMPETETLAGGYIVLASDLPVVAQELFATEGLTFMSATPPTGTD
jgi:hypothetical protein